MERDAPDYGGKPDAVFAISPLTRARFNRPRVERLLRRIHERLAAVYIDCVDWPEFVRRWDRKTTLFYLDPPYYGCELYYGRGLFARSDFERMAEVLGNIRGHVLLSLNDHPEVRRIFDGFRLQEVQTTYQISGGTPPVTELVIIGGKG